MSVGGGELAAEIRTCKNEMEPRIFAGQKDGVIREPQRDFQ